MSRASAPHRAQPWRGMEGVSGQVHESRAPAKTTYLVHGMPCRLRCLYRQVSTCWSLDSVSLNISSQPPNKARIRADVARRSCLAYPVTRTTFWSVCMDMFADGVSAEFPNRENRIKSLLRFTSSFEVGQYLGITEAAQASSSRLRASVTLEYSEVRS